MPHFGEFFADLGADPMSWAVGPHQQRKARLDLGIAPAQGVILGIADLRCILQIIKPVMLRDFLRQTVEFLLSFRRGQLIDRLHALLRAFFGGAEASAISLLAAARASLVTLAPDSMRAISSSRDSSSSSSMRVLSFRREMRKC